MTIAKPFFFPAPAPVTGIAIEHYEPVSARIKPAVKRITGISTIIMLALCIVVYGKDFINTVGTNAIGTQIFFYYRPDSLLCTQLDYPEHKAFVPRV
jgi:hypothetical protein